MHYKKEHATRKKASEFEKRNAFSTFDLGATTALVCLGYELANIDRSNPSRALFLFKREQGIEEAIDDYWSDNLEVKARRYFDCLKAVKNKLYSTN